GASIRGVRIAPYRAGRGRVVSETRLDCDFIAMSGGFNPALHLWCHNGGRIRFDETLQTFRPDHHPNPMRAVGAANGTFHLADCVAEAYAAGEAAAGNAKTLNRPTVTRTAEAPIEPLWFSPATGKYNEGNKHFVDF